MSSLIPGQISITNQFTVSTNGILGTIDPTGFSNLIFTGTALQTVNGCVGSNGKLMFVQNQGTNNVIFKNNDSSATTGAKIITGIGADMTIGPNQTVFLIYDNSTTCWKCFSLPPVTIQQTDYNQTDNTAQNYLVNKPTISAVGHSGNYSDIVGLPTLFNGAYASLSGLPILFNGVYSSLTGLPSLFNGVYSSLSGLPTLFNGDYNSLSNKPTIPSAQVNSDWAAISGISQILNKPSIPAAQVNSDWTAISGISQIINKPTFSTVATSGLYSDLLSKPSIPAAQVNSDWNSSSGLSQILNKPTLATVATSGLYADISGTPTIPSNTSQITESGNLYYTQARFDSAFTAKTTTNLSEGTNLYYTSARFNTALASKTTADLPEGTNLYYTQTRFNSAFIAKSTTDLTEGSNLYYTATRFNTAFSSKTTDNLTEGTTNVYYTDARVRADHVITSNVTRAVNSTNYTISSTKNARVYYTIRISCTATIGGTAAGSVLFQYSINAGSTWIDGASVENSNTVSLAVTLNSISVQTAVIAYEVPTNALCRMVSTSSGTTTITYIRGTEVTY